MSLKLLCLLDPAMGLKGSEQLQVLFVGAILVCRLTYVTIERRARAHIDTRSLFVVLYLLCYKLRSFSF